MIRNPNYYLTEYDNRFFLIPFGQEIVKRAKTIEINSFSKSVWDILTEPMSENEIVEEEIKALEAVTKDEQGEVRTDTRVVTTRFLDNGVFLEEDTSETEKFHKAGEALQETILDSEEMIVERRDGGLFVSYPTFEEGTGHFTLDVVPDFDKIQKMSRQECLSWRIPFAYQTLREGRFFIHSASVLYNGKVWLFSAPAGTGKSTQASFFEESGYGKQINGDLNLIGKQDGQWKVFGTPWCGTSEIFDLNTYPLGGIFFVRRDKENHLEELSLAEKATKLISASVSPFWEENDIRLADSIVRECVSQIPMTRLFCTLDPASATLVREQMDAWERGQEAVPKSDIVKLLSEGNCVQITPQGSSMWPLFVTAKDEAVLSPILDETIKRGDVCLYRSTNGHLVLHRVYRNKGETISFVGDHQTRIEDGIRREEVYGKMVAFIRKGKKIPTSSCLYRILSGVWLILRPFRLTLIRIGSVLRHRNS